jgi:hypothetical protein
VLDLTRHWEEFRIEFNTIRPHGSLSWNRPRQVQLGLANPPSPHLNEPKSCHFLDAERSSVNTKLPDSAFEFVTSPGQRPVRRRWRLLAAPVGVGLSETGPAAVVIS